MHSDGEVCEIGFHSSVPHECFLPAVVSYSGGSSIPPDRAPELLHRDAVTAFLFSEGLHLRGGIAPRS